MTDRVRGEPTSQRINRLLGTEDWVILHHGYELVTPFDLNEIDDWDDDSQFFIKGYNEWHAWDCLGNDK